MKDKSLKDAGYKYGGFSKERRGHILIDLETGKRELWFSNKNHAGYGIAWRNTHLEFASSQI